MSPSTMDVGDAHPQGSTLVCSICKRPPSCIAICPAKVYYVLGKQTTTHAFVHLGTHSHPVKDGELRDMWDRTCSLIGERWRGLEGQQILPLSWKLRRSCSGSSFSNLRGIPPRIWSSMILSLFWTNASTLRLLIYETRSPHLNTSGSLGSLIA